MYVCMLFSLVQFAWTHLTMFMLGSQAYLIMMNIFEAPFWFLLPVSMVICNDIMAYLFGESTCY
jgi:phosphatidate cytidylyltransferase